MGKINQIISDRNNSIIHNLVLVLFGTIIGFLLIEAGIRITMPSHSKVIKLYRFVESERGKFTRYDKILGWDGLEDAEDTFEWADTRHHVHHNRYGYRGNGYDFQRSDKKRFLVLGDSYVWGFGVENQHIFTSLIEQNSDNSIEVINTADLPSSKTRIKRQRPVNIIDIHIKRLNMVGSREKIYVLTCNSL